MQNLLQDIAVELADEFDQNFRRKAFFTKAWKPSKHGLIKTGAMRRSVQYRVEADGVRFTSNVPYAVAHNEGMDENVSVRQHRRRHPKTRKQYTVRAHQRRQRLPERRFVGDGPEAQRIIGSCCDNAAAALDQMIQGKL